MREKYLSSLQKLLKENLHKIIKWEEILPLKMTTLSLCDNVVRKE